MSRPKESTDPLSRDQEIEQSRLRADAAQALVKALKSKMANQEVFGWAVESVTERATEVFGEREKALRWLGTPVRALEFATPISLLAGSKGTADVLAVLGRIEHGVF